MQAVHEADHELVRVVLSSPLELLVHFAKGTFETPRVDGEDRPTIPHLAHSLGEGHHKVTLVSHEIVWVHLVLVGRMLLANCRRRCRIRSS